LIFSVTKIKKINHKTTNKKATFSRFLLFKKPSLKERFKVQQLISPLKNKQGKARKCTKTGV